MNKEETKEFLKKVLPVMQAFAEGKTIERKAGKLWTEEDDPEWWDDDETFRIQPEKKYVPYTFEDMQNVRDGWLKWKTYNTDTRFKIMKYDENTIHTANMPYTYAEAFDNFVWENGKPFGKEEKL
jgi:hypothetical protein